MKDDEMMFEPPYVTPEDLMVIKEKSRLIADEMGERLKRMWALPEPSAFAAEAKRANETKQDDLAEARGLIFDLTKAKTELEYGEVIMRMANKARQHIADLRDSNMPGNDHAADVLYLIDHSNAGWTKACAAMKALAEAHVNVILFHEQLITANILADGLQAQMRIMTSELLARIKERDENNYKLVDVRKALQELVEADDLGEAPKLAEVTRYRTAHKKARAILHATTTTEGEDDGDL